MKSIYSKNPHIHTQLVLLGAPVVILLIVLFYFQGTASAQPTANVSFVNISFTFVAAATPPPATPPPVPGAFTLNAPTTSCSGTNSHVSLSWTASPNGPSPSTNSGYFVYVDGVYQYNALHSLSLSDPAARNYGQVYRYQIEAVTIPGGRTFSNEQSVTARVCILPTVNITFTTPNGTFPAGGLPVSVNQNQPASINWVIQYGETASATSNPDRLDWNGSKNAVSGSQAVSTLYPGNYIFTLTASNIVGSTSASAQLNVLQYPPPFIQTTGGDVHTNENIYITPN